MLYAPNFRRYALGQSWNLYRGQLVSSLNALQRRCVLLGLSVQNIRTILRHLQNAELISIQTTKGGMIITICNYDEWHQRTHMRQHAMPTFIKPATGNVYIKKEIKKPNQALSKQPTHSQGQRLSEGERVLMEAFRRRQREVMSAIV